MTTRRTVHVLPAQGEALTIHIEPGVDNGPGRLGTGDRPASHHALRLVLIVGLDREMAAACIGYSSDEAITLWPSGLYSTLALAAIESPRVWHRCRVLLDAAFGDLTDQLERLPAIEIAHYFAEGRPAVSVFDLAAMLWSLLRRSQSSLDHLIARLGAELEVVMTGRASKGGAATSSTGERCASAARAG